MSSYDFRRLTGTDADSIVADLSTRQHLNPHEPLHQALIGAQQEMGFCPQAAQTAMSWLRLDGKCAIGRLRRSELIQLARSIHRFWQQAVASEAPASPPV